MHQKELHIRKDLMGAGTRRVYNNSPFNGQRRQLTHNRHQPYKSSRQE